ncbi:hypothetical protein MVES1_001486 [Malassezia vespertilionis]|uniref:uncharacterized protein n=1 Tax=Malassezia vespertilionis TaxID=2020962 RepID=UPI0024B1E9B7|nr:uncharacterized protein MVES1_001486 [Malassezia vespertilionis]WFD06144.1 hypothetical protein MVES1_001486 [Malassezia vespertilionis]
MLCQRFLVLVVSIFAVFSYSYAEVTETINLHRSGLIRRKDDSFYKPDQNWQDEEPGTILKKRKVKIAQSGVLSLGTKGYQLLYRTTGHNSKTPSYTVTTILIPENYDKDKLVVASVYEDSHALSCAPSRRLVKSLDVFRNVATSYQELFFTTLLHEGWVVTVPDHEGPNAAFTSGISEGHAILDSIRATLSFDDLDLDDDVKIAGYGYSGGAMAAGFAGSLQRSYADELNIVGWSIGGTITDLSAWLRYIDQTNGAGFALASIAGLVSDYPQLNWVERNLTARGKKLWEQSKHHCMFENLWATSYKHILSDEVFEGGSSFLSESRASKVLNNLRLGTNENRVPKAPVFMFHAVYDDVVPYSQAINTAKSWCDQGAKIRFMTNSGVEMGHTNTELFNLPNVVFFLRDRFKGKDWGADCQWVTTLNPYWNPAVLGKSITQVLQQVLDLVGGRIGPNDKILKSKISDHQTP